MTSVASDLPIDRECDGDLVPVEQLRASSFRGRPDSVGPRRVYNCRAVPLSCSIRGHLSPPSSIYRAPFHRRRRWCFIDSTASLATAHGSMLECVSCRLNLAAVSLISSPVDRRLDALKIEFGYCNEIRSQRMFGIEGNREKEREKGCNMAHLHIFCVSRWGEVAGSHVVEKGEEKARRFVQVDGLLARPEAGLVVRAPLRPTCSVGRR